MRADVAFLIGFGTLMAATALGLVAGGWLGIDPFTAATVAQGIWCVAAAAVVGRRAFREREFDLAAG